MQKTYIVDSMGRDTMALIKKELGDDAVIISKETVDADGIFGMFGSKKIQIVASNDAEESFEASSSFQSNSNSTHKTLPSALTSARNAANMYRSLPNSALKGGAAPFPDKIVSDRVELSSLNSGNGEPFARPVARTKPLYSKGPVEDIDTNTAERVSKLLSMVNSDPWETAALQRSTPKTQEPVRVARSKASEAPQPYNPGLIKELDSEMKMLQNMIRSLTSRLNPTTEAERSELPPLAEKLRTHLQNNYVRNDIIDNLLDVVIPHADDKPRFQNALRQGIMDLIPVRSESFASKESKPRVIAIIGSTGSGKTTTIAKMAAHYHLMSNLSVAFLTIDSGGGRPAALEQLEAFSNILDMETKLVISAKDLVEQVDKNQDKDIVLIDTAGRNHKHQQDLQQVSKFLTQLSEIEVFLSISATTRPGEIACAMENFSTLNYSSIIITKVDESSSLCGLLNVLKPDGPPISFLTNGQRIPDDIRVARGSTLADLIISKIDL